MKKHGGKILQTLSSTVVHKNPWYRVVHETFVTSVRTVGNYFVIDPHGTNKSVVIVAVVEGKMLLVKQRRYVYKRWTLELPMGGVEEGETSRRAAQRELAEETGHMANHLEKIATFQPMPLVREQCEVYFATQLRTAYVQPDETEQNNVQSQWYAIDEVYRLVDAGKIVGGQSLAALALVRERIASTTTNAHITECINS